MPTCEIDLRPGGKWRYVYEGPDDAGFSMSGEYREIKRPERLVHTETMNEAPVATLNELTIRGEERGRTVIRVVVTYPSKEFREAVVATGMMDGWAQSYDRLEKYLFSLK
jgi:uncharacterized protein YndB with AHSA1/START domain